MATMMVRVKEGFLRLCMPAGRAQNLMVQYKKMVCLHYLLYLSTRGSQTTYAMAISMQQEGAASWKSTSPLLA